tara:strand:- start:29 stop:136 length:108 start_codon:yes stop_codon:yes gene_type:complete
MQNNAAFNPKKDSEIMSTKIPIMKLSNGPIILFDL